MNRLLIVGPPGAGKGTQAVKIAEALKIPAISTGDIFRKNIKEETELGKEAKSYIDSGNLVPDSVTNNMVRARLEESDVVNGFLLDGYPRNTSQVHELDSILEAKGEKIDRVLLLVADNDELVERLLNRAAEQGRTDDNEEVIRHRLKVYEEERELTVMLLIDVSGSLEFGSEERTQRDLVTEIAATLSFSAIRNNDKIGVLFFSDHVEKFIPPTKGKGHILRIIRELLTIRPTGKRTDIGGALEYFMRVMRRQSVVFLLSDFVDDKDYSRPLAMARGRHDVAALQV